MGQIYNSDFEPILLVGETARLHKSDGDIDIEALAVNALPEYSNDFGAVAAASWLRDETTTATELDTRELAQFRLRVIDDVRLYLKNPQSTKYWRTRSVDFYLPQFPEDVAFLQNFYFVASEFLVWEKDYQPAFDIYAPLAVGTSKVLFSGYKFRCRQIPNKGKVDLWVNDWPSSGI